MNRRSRLGLIVGAILLLNAGQASAAVLTFNSLAAWVAATGGASWTVDFNSFAADASFQSSAVDAGPFSLAEQNGPAGFRNLIDVAPYVFAENNGTTFASMYTNFGVTTVLSTFDSPIRAWGAEFNHIDAEGLALDLGAFGSLVVPNGTGFFGFAFTAGETLSSLTFRSDTDIPGFGGEGFGLDNVVGTEAAVPEPITFVLLSGGLVGLAARRRLRRR